MTITMITLRRAAERGHFDHGWLDTYHTFSFADYHDRRFMGFRDLRVINDDRVQGGHGFPAHAHRDMEIITYVLDGALEHRDNMGNGSVIKPGDVQRMSAGKGVRHSEFNASKADPVHFLQIWIIPDVAGIPPEYEQKHFGAAEKRGRLRLVVAKGGRDGAVSIHQDASVYAGLFDGAETATLALAPGRKAYIHVARGSIAANGVALAAGDALKLSDVDAVKLERGKDAEVLVFDLP